MLWAIGHFRIIARGRTGIPGFRLRRVARSFPAEQPLQNVQKTPARELIQTGGRPMAKTVRKGQPQENLKALRDRAEKFGISPGTTAAVRAVLAKPEGMTAAI